MVGVLKWTLVLLGVLAVSACGVLAPGQQAETPQATATPAAAATPRATSTPTPKPTATAPAARVVGDPRSLSISEPVRQDGAPCGFVDTLDFPLDPPDGETASGGGDFNRYRERYEAFHAGEDWRFGRSTSFGRPVYSVGHGRVTYAQPLGWGVDKGVVILEHTFRGGRRILSFYGHLDPPSVTLRQGQCVARGEQVGNIGDPRTSPHLHFEMRVHLPDTPGPGYWPSDPRRVGWRPPSATIWYERMAAMPGVQWSILRDDGALSPLGGVDGTLLVASAAGELSALDPADGRMLWTRALPEGAQALQLDAASRLLYTASAGGAVEAYSTSALARGEPQPLLWRLEVGGFGVPDMAVLPGGGLVVTTGTAMLGVSVQGEVLWRREPAPALVDWVELGGGLAAVDVNRLWLLGTAGSDSWPIAATGRRIVASDQPFVYADDGLYRLDLDRRSAERMYALPTGLPRRGDLVELPGDGYLLAHADPADTRILAFDDAGSLRWERSIAGLGLQSAELLIAGDQALLLGQFSVGNASEFDLFHVDPQDGSLVRLFVGGSRNSVGLPARITTAGGLVLISVSGVGMFAWDPAAAFETVAGE